MENPAENPTATEAEPAAERAPEPSAEGEAGVAAPAQASTVPTPWSWHVWVSAVAFGAVGLVDGLLSWVTSEIPKGASITAVLLAAGLWMLLGLGVGLGQAFVWWAATGRGGRERTYERLLGWVRKTWQERATEPDRERVSRAIGFLVGGMAFVLLSVLFLASLIANRHGAFLIAATFVAAQLVLIPVAGVVGLSAYRATGLALGRFTALHRWVTLPMLAGLLVGGGAVVVAVGALLFWQVVVATDALSILAFPLLGIAAQWPTRRLLRGRTLARRWPLVAAFAALLLVFGAAQPDAARTLVFKDSYTAKYLLDRVQRMADFDKDGATSFPVWQDCAPFDPNIHPYALEIGGNGIDEDCDGEDVAAAYHLPQRRDHGIVLPKDKPNLVLVTVDSLRPDHLGFGGSKRKGISPHLDAFAAKSVVFTHAFSQDSGTGPSLWSLMAGKTPFQTKIDNSGRFPPNFLPEETLIAEVLKKNGYRTEVMLCGSVFATRHWNLRRGFDSYREVCGRRKALQAEGVTKQALASLKRLRAAGKPFFLWVHYYDPHEPYHDHPNLNFGKDRKSRYDEEIQYTDKHLGPFLRELTRSGVKGRTYVAFTADHGENWSTHHGRAPHARNLYNEVTRVPLVMWGTDVKPRVVDEVVALNDIHPTFLELAHIDFSHSTMVSQIPVLWGQPADANRLVFQENSFSRPRKHTKGAVGRGHHMIMDITNGTTELYDLLKDPLAKKNLAGTGLAVETEMARALKAFISTTKVPENLAK